LLHGIRRSDALNDDMDAEFRLHMELRAEDLVRSGLTPAEAARRARLEFGSTESFKDRGREARGLRLFDSLRFSMLDLKLGGRMLVKHPGLTVIGTIAVAFAIAIGTTAFEIGTQVVFPTIPLPNGDAIVVLRNWHLQANGPVGASRRDYARWKSDVTTVTDISAIMVQDRNVAVGVGGGEPVLVADVTASTFEMTRVPALRGRTLLPADERADAEPVIVIGYEFWQNKLGGVADVVGRVIRVSGTPTRIVGVMPRGYAFPRRHGLWRPLHLEYLPEAIPRVTFVVGRLAPGRTVNEASAEVSAIGERTATMFAETHRYLRSQVVSLPRAVWPIPSETSMVLGAVNVFLVMLIALVCGNVALLLSRAPRRADGVVVAPRWASAGRLTSQLSPKPSCSARWARWLNWSRRTLLAGCGRFPRARKVRCLSGWARRCRRPPLVCDRADAFRGGHRRRRPHSRSRRAAWTCGCAPCRAAAADFSLAVVDWYHRVADRADGDASVRDELIRGITWQRDTPAGFAAEQFLTAILRSIAPTARRPADTMPARAARLGRGIGRSPIGSKSEPGVISVTYAIECR
jgi:hypothetical protein